MANRVGGIRLAALVAAFWLVGTIGGAQAGGAPAPGRPDPTFGDGGVVLRDFGTEFGRGAGDAAMAGPDGTTLVLQPGNVGVAVARYLPDGGLDPSFGEGGIALAPRGELGAKASLAAGPDGTIVVFDQESVTRFTADGRLDTSWGREGQLFARHQGQPYFGRGAGVMLADGSTIAVDPTYSSKTPPGAIARRYGPDGRLDHTYGDDGRAFVPLPYFWAPVTAVASQGDGLLIVAPAPAEAGSGITLTRLDADGHLDTSFGEGGSTTVTNEHGPPVAMAQEADGGIVVATEGNGFLRFTASGRLDQSFGTEGVAAGPAPRRIVTRDLTVTEGGDLLAVGNKLTGTSRAMTSDFVAEELTPSGAPDPAFGGGAGFVTSRPGPESSNEALGAAVDPGGRIVLVGRAGEPGEAGEPRRVGDRIAIAALEADGAPASGFGTDGLVLAAATVPSKDAATGLLVGRGGAVTVAGHAYGRVALARFTPRGELDTSFGTEGTRLLPPSPFPRFGGTYRSPYWSRWTMVEGATLAAAPGGGFLVAPGSGTVGGVLKLTAGGTFDRAFGGAGQAAAGVLSETRGVGVTADGGILAIGATRNFGGALQRLLPDGAPDPSFGRDDTVGTTNSRQEGAYLPPLALAHDGRIAALAVVGAPIEFDPDGLPLESVDAAIGAAWEGARLPRHIVAQAFDGNRLVLLGQRHRGPVVARVAASGRPDPTFGDGGRLPLELAFGPRFFPGAVAVEPDGRILIAGVASKGDPRLSVVKNPGRAVVIRLDPDGTLDRTFAEGGVFEARGIDAVRVSALALGPGTITVGGAAVRPNSADMQMMLLRLGR